MIKAKDTVMSDKQVGLILDSIPSELGVARGLVEAQEKLCQAQAEISFKAGIRHTLSRAVGEGCLSTVQGKHGIHIPDELFEELSNESKP